MKLWKKLILGLLLLVAIFAVYIFLNLRSMQVEKLSDDLHVIRGVGSNVAVLRTDVGAVIVDTMTTHLQGKLIRARVKELTGQDTVMIINTHYHLDHTHGNPSFGVDTRVIATERTLSHLQTLDADFWSGDAAALLPNETFSDRQTLNVGGKTLHLIHPGRGHTDGDLVVVMQDEDTVVMGDLLFHRLYPNIDLEAGGSVQEWAATLEKVKDSTFSTVIPGHGPTTDRGGIDQFQEFMQQLAEIGRNARDNNLSLDEVLEENSLDADAGYGNVTLAGIGIGLTRDFVLRRAWEEATGNFTRRN